MKGMPLVPDGQTAPKHATVERKFIWKQLLPLLDPFTAAASSLLSHRVRPWLLSKNKLLIVPHLILNFGASPPDDRALVLYELKPG